MKQSFWARILGTDPLTPGRNDQHAYGGGHRWTLGTILEAEWIDRAAAISRANAPRVILVLCLVSREMWGQHYGVHPVLLLKEMARDSNACGLVGSAQSENTEYRSYLAAHANNFRRRYQLFVVLCHNISQKVRLVLSGSFSTWISLSKIKHARSGAA